MSLKDFVSQTVEGLFFECTTRRYWRFEHFGLQGEEGLLPMPAGASTEAPISYWFLPAQPNDNGPVRGTVLFCHAGTHSMGFHLPQISWLVPAGYNVLMFDYHGAGLSEGRPSLSGILEDARAMLTYAQSRPDVKGRPLALFGQGMGAFAAAVLASEAKTGEIAAVVLESMYATHRGWMLRRYGPGIGHFCAAMLPTGVVNPIDALQAIRQPLAIVTPAKDQKTPEKEVDDVVHAAPAQREIWRVEGKKFLGVFDFPSEWRERFLDFLAQSVKRSKAK